MSDSKCLDHNITQLKTHLSNGVQAITTGTILYNMYINISTCLRMVQDGGGGGDGGGRRKSSHVTIFACCVGKIMEYIIIAQCKLVQVDTSSSLCPLSGSLSEP